MGTTTPNFGLYKPTVGETGWGTLVDANWDTIDSNLTNGLPRLYRAGLATTLSGGTPSTVISIAVGDVQDAGNAGAIRLSSAITKNINATWAVGSGNGGLATSLTLTASTWYHLFLIKRTDTGVVDAYFDTSITAANIPGSYTLFRRIGSYRTDANKLLGEFIQTGKIFQWLRGNMGLNLDLDTAASGTSQGTITCTVPLGIKVRAIANADISAATQYVYFHDPDVPDQAPSQTAVPLASIGQNTSTQLSIKLEIMTNTLSQVNYRSSANGTIKWCTLGWWDFMDEF